MQRTFIIYNDPGHAWAKVPTAAISAVGLKASDFSGFSYLGNGCMFLEEDCDLGRFIKAYQALNNTDPKFNEKHCNNQSAIRHKHNNNPAAARYFVPTIAN